MRAAFVASLLTVGAVVACGPGLGSGTAWVNQPLGPDEHVSGGGSSVDPGRGGARPASRTIGAAPPRDPNAPAGAGGPGLAGERPGDRTGGGGKVLGTFRNTYYDFPREADHRGGDLVALMDASCKPIAKVPRGFYDAVCVQGSGSLQRGGTVSFAKRDCACAEVCPRTGQRICFDALDPKAFPFGRGATGRPITPLRSVAADTSVLPMGTVVYIPELDGAPRGDTGEAIDGCFVVEDRGMKVSGEHVDIFTGSREATALLNDRVPSNQGVTVVVSAPRCAGLAAAAAAAATRRR
jgi:3D (Asp-Asp-Asp) domain-containing protein